MCGNICKSKNKGSIILQPNRHSQYNIITNNYINFMLSVIRLMEILIQVSVSFYEITKEG